MKEFPNITQSFKGNINAVCIFSREIGSLADQHDKSAFEEFREGLEKLLDVEFDKLAKNDEPSKLTKDNNDLALSVVQPTSEDEASSTEEKNKLKERMKWMFETPEKAKQFFEILNSYSKQSPSQGYLLRRGALITLVSYFELLLADLLQEYYFRYPSALPSEDRVLSLADLRSIGTIEEAEKYLVMKEVDVVIRKSTQEQLDYFTKRLKIDLDPMQEYMDGLIEIVQRRNLIIHNDGIVNKIYLTQVSKSFIESNQIKDDQQLVVKKSYLSDAIDIIYTIGIILIQQCWRKWEKEHSEEADDLLGSHIYDALSEAEYNLTIKLARYVSKVKLSKDYDVRIATINHAIALKELGQIEEMEKLLTQFDWSSCAIKFLLALSVLHDDEDKIYELLPKAVAADEINRFAMDEWPLFRKLRETQRFREAIDHYFPNQ